jgi:hypothetical protein
MESGTMNVCHRVSSRNQNTASKVQRPMIPRQINSKPPASHSRTLEVSPAFGQFPRLFAWHEVSKICEIDLSTDSCWPEDKVCVCVETKTSSPWYRPFIRPSTETFQCPDESFHCQNERFHDSLEIIAIVSRGWQRVNSVSLHAPLKTKAHPLNFLRNWEPDIPPRMSGSQ